MGISMGYHRNIMEYPGDIPGISRGYHGNVIEISLGYNEDIKGISWGYHWDVVENPGDITWIFFFQIFIKSRKCQKTPSMCSKERLLQGEKTGTS